MLNEADTRAQLIDLAIHRRGWTEELIRREETAGTIEVINGKAKRRSRGKVDYVLRVKVKVDTQPVALALIETGKTLGLANNSWHVGVGSGSKEDYV